MEKPKAKENPDFTELNKGCQELIDYMDSEDFHSDGLEKYENAIMEKAVLTIFGNNVYDWINSKIY